MPDIGRRHALSHGQHSVSVGPARRLIAEALGSAFLLAAVVGSGIMTDRLFAHEGLAMLANSLATGGANDGRPSNCVHALARCAQTRRDGLRADLLQRAEHHELTEDELRVRFVPEADAVAMLARVVDAERQCCRFLRFVITVEPDGGPVFA
jgi:hypothetical protein